MCSRVLLNLQDTGKAITLLRLSVFVELHFEREWPILFQSAGGTSNLKLDLSHNGPF